MTREESKGSRAALEWRLSISLRDLLLRSAKYVRGRVRELQWPGCNVRLVRAWKQTNKRTNESVVGASFTFWITVFAGDDWLHIYIHIIYIYIYILLKSYVMKSHKSAIPHWSHETRILGLRLSSSSSHEGLLPYTPTLVCLITKHQKTVPFNDIP